jgi:hypothetical protein
MTSQVLLHKDAQKNFNEKALSLLPLLKKGRVPEFTNSRLDPEVTPNIQKVVNFPDDVEELSFIHLDKNGEENAKTFIQEKNLIGFYGEDYKNFIRLCEAIHKNKSLNKITSFETLKDIIFKWFELKFNHKEKTDLTTFLLEKVNHLVEELEVLIPIPFMRISLDFDFGKIRFKTLKRSFIDSINLPTNKKENLIGQTVASIKLLAEPQRAIEIASQEAEKAVSLFRFFCSSNFNLRNPSFLGLSEEISPKQENYLIANENKITSIHYGIKGNDPSFFYVHNQDLELFKQCEWENLEKLLVLEKLNEFQEDLLNALLIYSKNAIEKDVSLKLIYVLIAIESMLLKDKSEPIQNNIGERMALFIGQSLEEKKEIVSLVKKIYDFRSSFLHHGQQVSIDQSKEIESFLLYAWETLRGLTANSNKEGITKAKFLQHIDDRKFS